MEFYFIFLGFLIIRLKSSVIQCQDKKFQPFLTCYSYISNCYILEGNEEDYTKIKHIDTQIIKPFFLIPQQEEPILIRILDSLDEKKKIQEKVICSLFRKFEYSIVCISVDLVYQEDQITFIEKLRFDTKIDATELCEQIDFIEDGSFNLFCLSQFSLKQYNLNLSRRNVTFILEHDVKNQIQNSCKIKQIKWNKNQYIIAFYQCSSWKILYIKNNEVNTLLESQMKDQYTLQLLFSFINDVSFCVWNQLTLILYLIEKDFYLQIEVNSKEKVILNYHLFQHTKVIQKLLVQMKCQIIIVVNSTENSNSKVNDSSINELNLNLKNENNKFHFYSDILFLQNQFELNVFLNPYINQTYQISNTPLFFFDFDKLFCQYDQSNNTILFYRYYQLNSFIKPKQKYLYLIHRKDLFQNDTLFMCLRIIYENNTLEEKSQLVEQITVQHNCQSKFQQKIWKSEALFLFQNSSFNLYNNEGSISVSIQNNQKFLNSCLSKLQSFYFKDKIELRQINIPYYISFQKGSHFYIYNCKQNKIIISINRDQFEVLESQGDYYIINKNITNHLRVIQFQGEQLLQLKIKFEQAIINFKKFSQSVIIYMNNSNLPPLIYQNFQLNEDGKYLSKSLYQSEPILFYQEMGYQKLIQYKNFIAVENQGNVRCFKFQVGLIISIQTITITNKDYSIIAIQNFTRSLILIYCNDYELHQIFNYSFSDYVFSYPFKYIRNPSHLAILMMQNKELYIAIFKYNISSLQFQEIIQTDDSFFTFYQSDLLYYWNKEWRYLLLNQILVEVEINHNFLKNISLLYQKDLYPNKQQERSIQLILQIQNNCQKIYPLKNLFNFEIKQNQTLKLQISDIFYGPINNLTIITNSSIFFNGPFQLKKKVQPCNLDESNFCIKQFEIESQVQRLIFSIIIMENQVFEIINTFSNIKIIYIMLIKQNYYLLFLQSENNLNIQLIYCSELIDQNCYVITDLNEKFQIQPITADILRTGNLIKLKNQFNQSFIYFEDIKFILVQLPEIVMDVIYIEETQDQYLIIQQNKQNSSNLELMIYSIYLNKKSIVYSLSIPKQLYIKLINDQKFKFQELKLTSCIQIGGLTKIKLFIITQYYSYLFQLILDKQKNQVQFELQKSVRNCDSQNCKNEIFTIDYFDDIILILKEINNNHFLFFDLRKRTNFYDYFHKSLNQIKIKRINTTHFIFFENLFIYQGTIGYEIEQLNSSEINYNFELHAQNDISNEKALFQIHIIQQKYQFTNTLILILLSCFIFIIIYLRSQKQRTYKQLKIRSNLQVSQIIDI